MSVSAAAMLCALAAGATPSGHVPRVAIVVGNDRAPSSRAPLRFAERDAESFASVLRAHGDLVEEIVVLGKEAAELEVAFDAAESRLRELGPTAQLFFFYSGHADETALLLGDTRTSFEALKARLRSLPSAVFVAVIDACYAGAMTRAKGARAVDVVDLPDVGGTHRGGVIITSASARESAQESDAIGASFFTHYFSRGLEGAADLSGDGRVSLEEAYRFAYRQTVARTSETLLGAQHPSFDVDLAGRDELILTWLDTPGYGRLILGDDIAGLVTVRRDGRDETRELYKTRGQAMGLVVEPGRYRVAAVDGAHVGEVEIVIEHESSAMIEGSMLALSPRTRGAAKGDASASGVSVRAGYALRSGIFEGASLGHGPRVAIARRWGDVIATTGVAFSMASYAREDGVRVSSTETGGTLGAAIVVLESVWMRIDLGANAAFAHVAQTGTWTGGDDATNHGVVGALAGSLASRFALAANLSAWVGVDAGVSAYRRTEGVVLRPSWELSSGAELGW